jgi:hypothetical protein
MLQVLEYGSKDRIIWSKRLPGPLDPATNHMWHHPPTQRRTITLYFSCSSQNMAASPIPSGQHITDRQGRTMPRSTRRARMTCAETFSLMLQATTSTSKKKHHSLQASIVKSFSPLLLLAMTLSMLHHSPWPPLHHAKMCTISVGSYYKSAKFTKHSLLVCKIRQKI